MAATAASDVTDGPVLSLINKRLRALRKKHNRILQMEESLAKGKALNKEQEETLRSKSAVIANIDELEKLRQPLSAAISEEVSLAIQSHQVSSSDTPVIPAEEGDGQKKSENESEREPHAQPVVEDLLNLLYFASMFDVKTQSDFTATMLTRTHERGCCLTYDYVTDDDAADLLGERDLDLLSMLGTLLISRPVDSSLSHKNALQKCIEHAKRWLEKSDQPIEPNSDITYATLRMKLNKIMASDYFTTVPEMKAPVEVAAAAGNYGSYQVPVHGSVVPVEDIQYEEKEEEPTNIEGHEIYDDHSSPGEELPQGESEIGNLSEVPAEAESLITHTESLEEADTKEQQYINRRLYQNYRGGRGGGGGGGRRGYLSGRGGRGSGRGGGYQNGRNQYYDQSGNYYARNYYNYRGRGGRGTGGNYNPYSASQAGQVAADS